MNNGENLNQASAELLDDFYSYIKDILQQLRSRGLNVSESEILAYFLEKMSHRLKVDQSVDKGSRIRSINDVLGNMDDLAIQILHKKYPMLDNQNISKQSRLQRLINRKSIQNLPSKRVTPIYRGLLLLNWLFVLSVSFLALNASFSLIIIATSGNSLQDSFLVLNGSLVLFYDLLYSPEIMMYWGIICFTLAFLTMCLFYMDPIRRSVENLSNRIFQFRSWMFLNILSFTFYSLYICLGSLVSVTVDNVTINRLDFVADVIDYFIVGLTFNTIAAIISIKLVRELPNNSVWLHRDNAIKKGSYRLFRIIQFVFTVVLIYSFVDLYQLTYNRYDFTNTSNYRNFYIKLTLLNFSSLVLTSFYLFLVYYVKLFQIPEYNSWFTFTFRFYLIHMLTALIYCGFLYFVFSQVLTLDQGLNSTFIFSYDMITTNLLKYMIPQSLMMLILMMNKTKV